MRLFTPPGAALLAALFLLATPAFAADRGVFANPGDKLTAAIDADGDTDPFTMDLAAGGFLSISLKTKELNLTGKLYRPDGQEVGMSPYLTGTGTGKLSLKKFPVPAGQTGTWTFVVAGADGRLGSYLFTQKYKPPKGFKRKGDPVPAGQVVTYDFPGADGALVSIKLKEAAGGPLADIRLLGPDGTEVPGAAAALLRKKTTVSMKSFRLGQGFGDYTLELTGAPGGAVTVGVSAKVKFPKPLKRSAVLGPEATVDNLSIASVRQEASGLIFTLIGSNLAAGATVVFEGEGIDVTAVGVDDSSTAQITVNVAADAPFGMRDLTWVPPITVGEAVTLPDALTVQAPLPTITNVDPAAVTQGGGGVEVTVTGTGFRPGGSIGITGTGVSLSGAVLDSDTSLRATVTALSAFGNTIGPVDITYGQPAAGGGDQVTAVGGVTVNAPTPSIGNVTPTMLRQGDSSMQVTVTGSNFRPGGVIGISGSGLTLGSTTVLSATTATVNVTVSDGATVGDRDVTFTQAAAAGGAGVTDQDAVAVRHPVPSITLVTPSSFRQGESGALTLTGSGFRSGGSVSTDATGVTLSSPTWISNTSFDVDYAATAGAALGPHDLTYTQPAGDGGGAETTATDAYSVYSVAPTLTGISPDTLTCGGGGVEVTLTGTNFSEDGAVSVSATGVAVSGYTRDSATQVRVTLTASDTAALGAADVTYTQPLLGGGESVTLDDVLQVDAAAPGVSLVSPDEIQQGDTAKTVTITGTKLRSGGAITISGAGLTLGTTTVHSLTSASVPVTVSGSATLSQRDVTFTQPAAGGGASATLTNGIEVVEKQTQLTSMSPSRIHPGDTRVTVTITGSGYDASTTVGFAGTGITTHSTTYDSATQLTLEASVASSATLGGRDVTITPGGGSAAVFSNKFYVAPADPIVTGFSHAALANGANGTAVVVTGANFRSGAALSASGSGVSFSSVVVSSDVKITANVSVTGGATTGLRDLAVSHSSSLGGRGGTLDSAFRVVAASPTVGSANPSAIGVTGSGGATRVVPVEVTGTNFSGGATVTVTKSGGTGITAGTATVLSNTKLTLDLTINGAATTGAWDVKVTNPGSGGNSGSTGNGKLTMNGASTLTVNRVLPGEGSAHGGERVTIHGAGFSAGDVVDFGAKRAYGTQVIDQNTIVTTVPQPASTSTTAATSVNVKVTASGGSSATLTGGFAYDVDEVTNFVVKKSIPADSATGIPKNRVSACLLFPGPVDPTTVTYGTTSQATLCSWWESGGFYTANGAVARGPNDRWVVYTRTGGGNLAVNNAGVYVLNIPTAIQSIAGVSLVVDLVASTTFDQRTFTLHASNTDTTAPTLSSILPTNGSSSQHTTTAVTLAFSEELDPQFVRTTNITLKQASTVIGAHIAISDDLRTVTLTPHTELSTSTTYTVAVGSAVTDLYGNSFSATNYTFTTGSGTDSTSPVIDAVVLEDLPASMDGSGTYVNSSGTSGNAFDLYLDRSGCKIRVDYSDQGGAGIDPTTFSAKCSVAVGSYSANAELRSEFTTTHTGAEWTVPSGKAITAGENVVFTFLVKDLSSNTATSKTVTVDVVAKSSTASASAGGDLDPVNSREVWIVRGDLDHYTASFTTQSSPAMQGVTTTVVSNGKNDLDETLRLVGLHSTSMSSASASTANRNDTGTNAITRRLVLERIRELLRERFEIDSDGTRDAGSVDIEFLLPGEQGSLSSMPVYSTTQSSNSQKSFSEMSFGATLGAESSAYAAGTTNGTAWTDPRNLRSEADINNDGQVGTFLMTMLKREVNGSTSRPFYLKISSKFVTIHGGTPVGEHASDDDVLADTFDRSSSANTTHNTRYDQIMDAIEIVALMAASTGAHEIGHGLGFVEDKAPKTGQFGGAHYSNTFTRATSASPNTSAHLAITGENNLMAAGSTFLEKIRSGTEFQRFCGLLLGHLRRNILYDEGK